MQEAQAIVAERARQAKALASFNAPPVSSEPVPESAADVSQVPDPNLTETPAHPTSEQIRASIIAELDARANEVLDRIRASEERVAAIKAPEVVNHTTLTTNHHKVDVDEDELVISKVEEVAHEFEEAEASRHRKLSARIPSPQISISAPTLDTDLETRIRLMTENLSGAECPPPPPPPPLPRISSLPAELLAKRHLIARKLAAKKAANAAAKSSTMTMPKKMATATPVMVVAGGNSQDDDLYDLLGV